MVGIRFTRALTVLTLIASLAVLPAAAQAAPRDGQRDDGGVKLLASLLDWVSSIWGAGGGNWDPGARPIAAPVPEPAAAPTPEVGAAAQRVLDRPTAG